MRSFTLLAVLFFSVVFCTFAQDDAAKKDADAGKKTVQTEFERTPTEKPIVQPVDPNTSSNDKKSLPPQDAKNADKQKDKKFGLTDTGYVRPDADRRFKNYVNSVAGSLAVARYTMTAGLLTWRNSPSEWNDRLDGFGRRFANAFGKSVIRNTTVYALDEALKVDSNFYRSRDRRVLARMRNSVFSAVTARNEKGKRVIGIPRIAGGFASEVISSTMWYPQRFDHVHGLKGGLISIGVNVGFNLFREFVWKR